MRYTYIISEVANSILYLTLNRPKKHNALCVKLVEELSDALDKAIKLNVNALFILGNSKSFSAGGDLNEMKELSQIDAEKRSTFVQQTFKKIQALEVPVVAFVAGICFGGGLELAMHADIRICTDNARLALPEVKYGMIPGAGGTVQLPNYLTKADAAYYLLTGNEIPLQKALNAGLIQKIIPEQVYNDELKMQAKYFESANGRALKAIKHMVDINSCSKNGDAYKKESEYFSSLLAEQGHKEIDDKFIKNK